MSAKTDPTLGTGSSIGRYFSIVSVVPSTILAFWLYLLIAAGSIAGTPSFQTLVANSPLKHPEYAIGVLALAIALAVVTHPIQFTLVQLLEGYWGESRLARNARARQVSRHLDRMRRLQAHASAATDAQIQLAKPTASGSVTDLLSGPGIAQSGLGPAVKVLRNQADIEVWAAVQSEYPDNLTDLLPTHLGNRLRRYESLAGRAVHLPVLQWATHISMVAKPEHNEYVNDQRTQLDLAVRVAALMGVASVITFALLWQDGWYLLLSLIPYTCAYVSYRGAVVAADSYGRALQAWIDLNRLRLYDELGLPRPTTTEAEREQNDRLIDLICGHVDFDISLEASAPILGTNGTAPL
jgi:hypothetical protein